MNGLVESSPDLPEATFAMKVFYLIQGGKHLSKLISHTFIKLEGNFYEYLSHHFVSVYLILFSYLTNQWPIGIMVLIIHDASDMVLMFARGYKVIRC